MKAIYTIQNFAKRLVMVLAVGLMAVNAWGDSSTSITSYSDGTYYIIDVFTNASSQVKYYAMNSFITSNKVTAVDVTSYVTLNLDGTITLDLSTIQPKEYTLSHSSSTYYIRAYDGSPATLKYIRQATGSNNLVQTGNEWSLATNGSYPGRFAFESSYTSGSTTSTCLLLQGSSWNGSAQVETGAAFKGYSQSNRNASAPKGQYYGSGYLYLVPVPPTCDKSVTINKGTGTNCTFTLSKSGSQASCDGVSTTVTVSPNTGYTSPSVTQSGASIDPSITGSGNSWTVSYGNNTTGTSTIAVSCSANNYTISLDNQSATTAGSTSIAVTYNATTNLTGTPAITKPTKTHYDFGGYYTAVGGGGSQIIDANGDVVASVTNYTSATKQWIKADNVTLYAKWTEHGLKNYRTTCDESAPRLNVSPTTLNDMGYKYGESPTPQSFSMSGENLASGTLTVTAPTDYEVSKSSGSGYASSITFTGVSGTLSSTTVYVRLISGKATGDYNNEKVAISGCDLAKAVNVTCNGSVYYEDIYMTGVHATTYSTYASGVAKTGTYDVPVLADVTPSIECEGLHYHFAGWVTDANKEAGTISGNIISATGTKTANNTTYWAVWEQESSVIDYVKITSTDDVVDGVYVIISNGRYLPNTNTGSKTSPASGDGYAVSLNGDESKITSEVTSDMRWYFTMDEGVATIMNAASDGDYLYEIENGDGIRIHTTSDTWTVEENSTGFALLGSNNSRYCAIYNNVSWRSYQTKDYSNYDDGGIVYLYKETITFEDPVAECAAVTCGTPTGMSSSTPSDPTAYSATLSWTAPSTGSNSPTKYQYRVWSGNSEPSDYNEVASTSASVSGLLSNTTYKWKVRSYCGEDDESLWCATQTFTTAAVSLSFDVPGDADKPADDRSSSLTLPDAGVPSDCGSCWTFAGWTTATYSAWAGNNSPTIFFAKGSKAHLASGDGTTLYAVYTIKDAYYVTVPSSDTYDVTWLVEGESYTTGSPSTSVTSCGIETMPTAPGNSTLGCADTFVGWSESEMTGTGNSAPTDLFARSGKAPIISVDKVFHAVFATEVPEGKTSTSQTTTFTTKAWGDANSLWEADSNGFGIEPRGVQVTTGLSGLTVTSLDVYTEVSSVVITYGTAVDVSGSISAEVGETTMTLSSGSISGGQTDKTLTFTPTAPATSLTGAVSFTITVTNKSIYIKSVQINYKRYAYKDYITYCTNTYNDATNDHKWSTGGNWSCSAAPNIHEPVIITKPVTVDVVNAKAKEIILNQTTGNTGKLEISAGKALAVAETIKKTTDGETLIATAENDIVIESNGANGTGALVAGSESTDTKATVQFYSKAKKDGGGKYINQYFGTPFASASKLNYYGSYLRKFDVATDKWVSFTEESSLNAWTAYRIMREETSEGTYDVGGTLVLPGTTTHKDKVLTLTKGAADHTDNMFANSWTAPIDVTKFDATTDFTGAVATIYVFNAGSSSDGTNTYANKDAGAGNWNAMPVAAVKAAVAANPSQTTYDLTQIPSQQAFLVQTDGSGGTYTLKLDYKKLVYDPIATNGATIIPTRAPKRTMDAEVELMQLKLTSESGLQDRVLMYISDDFSADELDNGWEAYKLAGSAFAPQICANTPLGEMAISATDEIEGTVLGFYAGTEDGNYTFSFEYNGEEMWYLNDLDAKTSTPISNERTYRFTATRGTATETRFTISKSPIVHMPTGVDNGESAVAVRKLLIHDNLYIIREGRMYNAEGILVK